MTDRLFNFAVVLAAWAILIVLTHAVDNPIEAYAAFILYFMLKRDYREVNKL